MKLFTNRQNKKITEYQHQLIKTHFDEVELMYTAMRGWRHDYKQHIATLKSYAQDGDLPAIISYLGELSEDLAQTEKKVKTGNKMLDAILNSKLKLAEDLKITVNLDAEVMNALTTPALDLCIIVGNLFDNALEASLQLPENERFIRIYMTVKQNNQLYISFTNVTAAKKQVKYRGLFKSTKGANRGLGLARMDEIIKKHQGYVNRNSEDGAFSTEILLPQGS